MSSPKPSLVICSPSKRTTETLHFFLPSLKLDLENVRFEKALYEAGMQDLVSILENLPDSEESVLIIGHNPGLSILVDYYTGNELDMPTCGYAEITFQIDSWSELSRNTGLLISFEYPKK
jgi:phosphohistidine phosphatase